MSTPPSTPSHRVLSKLVESIPGAVYQLLVDKEGAWRFLYLSPGIEELFGVSAQAAYADASRLTECILPAYRADHRAALEDACRNQTTWVHEHPIKTPSGQHKWIRAEATPDPRADGSIQWFGILIDITASRNVEGSLRRSEAQHQGLLANIDAGVVVHAPDTRILMANPAASRMLGLEPEGMRSRGATTTEWSFVREDESPMPSDEFPVNRVLETGEPVRNLILGINRQDRVDRAWVLANAFPDHDEDRKICAVTVSFVDLTERVQFEKRLEQSENLVRSVLDSLPESVVVIDAEGNILKVNDAWQRLAEENRAEALIRDPVGMNYGAICRSADDSDQETGGSAAWHGISSVLRGERDRFTLEYPCATPQEDKWFRMRVVPLAGRVTSGAVIAHEEITERKRLEASLHAMATTDELTGLANRRQFFTFLRDEHARLKRRTGHCAAVLMMDLDRFKAVNDTYGHEAGDAVLAHVAGLIQHSLREVDKAGRLGGEEFGVLLGEADAEAAESYAERLRQDIAGIPTIYDSHTIPMTISIGIAVLTADDLNVETVLRKADEAMYRAKPEVGGPSLK